MASQLSERNNTPLQCKYIKKSGTAMLFRVMLFRVAVFIFVQTERQTRYKFGRIVKK